MISRRVCLAAVVALGLTACFGSGPEAAVQGFYGAVAEGNTDKAMGFLALESVSANEMIMVKGKIHIFQISFAENCYVACVVISFHICHISLCGICNTYGMSSGIS